MSEIKPVIAANDRMPKDKPFDPFTLLNCFGQEVIELRAALEALQKQNSALKCLCEAKTNQLSIIDKQFSRMPSLESDNKGLKECNAILTEENASQAKRIAELEAAVLANHEWHKEYFENEGYEDSELFKTNAEALSSQKGTE